MARVLITGAAGFLGSHLCDRFIAEGYDVLAMDNLITGNMENLEHLLGLPNFTFYHHDVSNYVQVPHLVFAFDSSIEFEGIEFIFEIS